VGAGHFAEMGQRATKMQEEGMKILGAINQVIKSSINLIYDLKEFEIRLAHYADARAKDKRLAEGGMLALKQIWLDQVDIKRGRGSIHQMSYELGFTTLRDAFMISNSIEDAEKMANNKDGIINDQVKRILIPRISEFLKWKELSEKELRKRFEIEKTYLKSQVETLKLYTGYARPYLRAAEELRLKGFEGKAEDFLVNPKNPALVNMFNTAMFEIVLFGKKKIDLKSQVEGQKLPRSFINYKPKREYFGINVVSLVFRGIPQKVTQQAYGFGGRVEITFDSYALNEDEVALLKRTLEKDDVESAIKFSYEATEESLNQLKEDIDRFTKDDESKKEEKKENKIEDPFTAFVSIFRDAFKKKEKKGEKGKKVVEKIGDIKKDDYVEGYLRKLTAQSASGSLYTLYDVYKKAHGHASSPESFA
jgi:hypothetical protein